MPEQTDVATRIVRARDLKPGDVIVRRIYDMERGSRTEQQVVLDIETHRSGFNAEPVTSGIAIDPEGEQVELITADWTLYRLVVSP
jgi:hypothetical protein